MVIVPPLASLEELSAGEHAMSNLERESAKYTGGSGTADGNVQIEHRIHVDDCKLGAAAVDSQHLRAAFEDILAFFCNAWQADVRVESYNEHINVFSSFTHL
jgi:hypothetical protein